MTLFKFHKLNADGQAKALAIAKVFDVALAELEAIVDANNPKTREFSIVQTKLEEACFFAKKAMAIQPKNQEGAKQ